MITIRLDASKSGVTNIRDTLRSLCANASDRENYEVLREGIPDTLIAQYTDSIYFVESPTPKSKVVITIPADAICLLAKWEIYFLYDLENNKEIDWREVIKRMMLTGHRESTLAQEISVEYTTK